MASELAEIRKMVTAYERSVAKTRVTILVFGPGAGNPDDYARACYEKRLQLKELLASNKFLAVLPEQAYREAEKRGNAPAHILDFEEFLLEHSADIAFVLHVRGCEGVNHELTRLSTNDRCARKMYCFVAADCDSHWSLKDCLQDIEARSGRAEQFTRDDIDKCRLCSRALEYAKRVRIAYHHYARRKYAGVS